MAANLDRAETSLTAVSDIAYIRGIDGSGNSVRISKADLANVLGVGLQMLPKESLTEEQFIRQNQDFPTDAVYFVLMTSTDYQSFVGYFFNRKPYVSYVSDPIIQYNGLTGGYGHIDNKISGKTYVVYEFSVFKTPPQP